MLRVAHITDLHLTRGDRFADTYRCIEFAIDDAIAQGAQLFAIGGDLTGTVTAHESEIEERNGLDVLFQKAADHAPVVILCGNHDRPSDLEGYGRLKARHPVSVALSFQQVTVETPAGPCIIWCVPYPDKTLLSDLTGSFKEQNHAAADVLRDILRSWSAAAATTVAPRIMLGHINIAGALTSGDEILANNEIELTSQDLDALDVDAILLGHIHRCQAIAQKARITGSVSSQTWGEPEEKGYHLVDVERCALPVWHRRLTPSRKFISVKATWNGTALEHVDLPSAEQLAGAEVRIQLEIPEEHNATCPRRTIEAEQLQALGAAVVKLDPHVTPRLRVRAPEILTARTNIDRIEAYWGSLELGAPSTEQRARCRQKYDIIERGELPPTQETA